MKKILTLLALSLTVMVIAQNKITEGVIFSTATMNTDNELIQAQFDTMGDMKTVTYFKDGKSRAELSNPMSGDVITLIDSKNMLVLMDNPALGKLYMVQNIKEAEAQVNDIEVIEGTKIKTILGYKCKQFTIKVKQDAGDVEMEIYTTEDIPVKSQQISMAGDKVKGFPLYVAIKMNQMGADVVITTQVTEIKEETVSDDKFNMTPPEGYKNMNE
ncbi:MAG: DUF4412 domain-containing protein [Winogradskyella sp.]|nr:MAG: DUF4412 domain-containing protein [Winogradskyella sp.]